MARFKLLYKGLPYFAIVAVNLIWGATPVIAKLGLEEFPAMTLAFLRFFLASLLLLPFVLTAKKGMRINRVDWPIIVGIGLALVTFHIFFFFEGLKRTEAIDASVLSLVVPIFSVLAGWWFLREKIYVINLFGVLMGILGALTIIGVPLLFLGDLTAQRLIGNVLVVLSGLMFVIGAVLSRKALKLYSPLTVIFYAFIIGAISFFPLMVIDYFRDPNWVYRVTLVGLSAVVFLTFLSSISAYFLYEWGIKRIGIIRADLIQYIQPAIAASLAVPLLGERISYSFVVGTCLIVLGVYWGTLGKLDHGHHGLRHHRG